MLIITSEKANSRSSKEKIKTIIYYDEKKQPPTGFPVSGQFCYLGNSAKGVIQI